MLEEIERHVITEEFPATVAASHLLLSRRNFGKAMLGAAVALTLPVEEAAADGTKKATESAHQGAETRNDQPTTLMRAMGFYLREERGSYYLVIPGLKNGERLQLQVANPTQFIDRDESGTYFEVKVGQRRYELRLQSREVPEYPKWINRPVWSVREVPKLKEDIPYVGPHISDEAVEKFPYQAQVEFLGKKIIAPISEDGYANLHTGRLSDKKLQLVLDPRTGKVINRYPRNIKIIPATVEGIEKMFIRFGEAEKTYEVETITAHDWKSAGQKNENHRPQIDENVRLVERELPNIVDTTGQRFQRLPEEFSDIGFQLTTAYKEEGGRVVVMVNSRRTVGNYDDGDQIFVSPANLHGRGSYSISIKHSIPSIKKQFERHYGNNPAARLFCWAEKGHYFFVYGIPKDGVDHETEISLSKIKQAIGLRFAIRPLSAKLPILENTRIEEGYPSLAESFEYGSVKVEDDKLYAVGKTEKAMLAPFCHADESLTTSVARLRVGQGGFIPVRLIREKNGSVVARFAAGAMSDLGQFKVYMHFLITEKGVGGVKVYTGFQKMISFNGQTEATSHIAWPKRQTGMDWAMLSVGMKDNVFIVEVEEGGKKRTIRMRIKTEVEGATVDDNLVVENLEELLLTD